METLAIGVRLTILVEMNGYARNMANVVRKEEAVLAAYDTGLDVLEPLNKSRVQSLQEGVDGVHYHLDCWVLKELLESFLVVRIPCVL